MPVTVAALVANRSLDLRLHTTAAAVDRPVSWVHVSELADPTPFLEGGELLLTTGVALRDGAPVGDYVARLVGAGVVGLGFGTGVGRDEVPAELVAAAEDGGLALVEVPRPTPFIAISRTVSAALAADEYGGVARAATAQQELVRAALTPGAPVALLERLARLIGGWVLLLDTAGGTLEAVPATAGRRSVELRSGIDRLRGMRAPAGAALSGPGETVLLQSLGNGSRSRGFLAVGRPGAFPAADRHIVNAAALLLTLRLEQSRALDSAMAALRAALLRLLLAGEEAAVAGVVRELGAQLPGEPLTVVAVLGTGTERAAAVDVVADASAQEHASFFSAELDELLLLLVPADGPVAAQLPVLAERVPGAVFGSSAPSSWSALADGVRQARQAVEHGRTRSRPVTAFADLAASGLASVLDPAGTRGFAESLLAPLVAADRAGTGQLVESLRTWLAHHGQWEPAAAALGVHRHTLRKRVRRAADLLGRDLDEAGTRVELWVALHPPP